jgi:hypothetical protein
MTTMRVCYIVFISLLLSICFAKENSKDDGSVCGITPPSSKPYKLSVCTMVFNEALYIEEWLAYHMLLKVDHFFIYDDGSSDNLVDVLEPYIKLGVVTLIPWGKTNRTVDPSLVQLDPEYTRKQRFAIADCLFNHKDESEWFGVFDVDEFLVLNKYWPDMHAFLPFAQINADDYPIPMTIFGTSMHTKTPKGWVLENYQWRSNMTLFGVNPYDNKFNGKSLYKSGCGLPNVHFTNELRPGCKKFCGWISAEVAGHHLPLTIHHYAVKSWEHYQEKIAKWHFVLVKEDFEKYVAYSNGVWDNYMQEYVKPIENLVKCMRKYYK